MTHEHDRLEKELAALRPVEPSAELAERIGGRIAAGAPAPIATARINGTRSVPTTYWLALAGAVVAAGVAVAVVLWRGDDSGVEFPVDLPQPTLASALDETLPSLWAYREALASPEKLDSLLDKHARLVPAPGESEQTRGFAPMTIDLNSRLGGL